MTTLAPNMLAHQNSPACPGCGGFLLNFVDGRPTRCTACNWKGRLFVFDPPVEVTSDRPRQALAGDVTCAFHATKQAVKICAGTGSYICELCAVEVNGQTYSAQYLNQGGTKKIQEAFDRTLKRPDRIIGYLAAASFFPYTAIAGPVLLILAFIQYARYRKQLAQDSLLRKVVPRGRGVALVFLFVAWIGFYLLVGMGITLAILSSQDVVKF